MSGWASSTLRRCHADLDRILSELNLHPESDLGEELRRALDAIEEADSEIAHNIARSKGE